MKQFFTWINQRTSSIKAVVSIMKRSDSSKKVIFSVDSTTVMTSYSNATFTLDREVSLISEVAPFVHGDEIIVSFKILGDKGDKGDEGPPVNGGGMIPYEPFGITSAFTQYLFNNGQQKIVFNQFIPPTNGDYTHIKLYATNALNTSGYYTGSVGAAIYSHIDAPTLPGGTGSGYNAGNMNGYPYKLETSGVITLNNQNVQNTYLTIEFDRSVSLTAAPDKESFFGMVSLKRPFESITSLLSEATAVCPEEPNARMELGRASIASE